MCSVAALSLGSLPSSGLIFGRQGVFCVGRPLHRGEGVLLTNVFLSVLCC